MFFFSDIPDTSINMSLRDFVRFRAVYVKHQADVAIMAVQSNETVNANINDDDGDDDDDDDTEGVDDHECGDYHTPRQAGSAPVSTIPKKKKVFRMMDLEPMTDANIPIPMDDGVPPTPAVEENHSPFGRGPVAAAVVPRSKNPKRLTRPRK